MTPTNEAGHGLPYPEIIDLLKSAQSNIAAKRPDWDEDDAAHWDRIDAAVSALEHHESLALSRGVPAARVQRSQATAYLEEVTYDKGWNDCRAAMLAPAAAGAQGEDDAPVWTKEMIDEVNQRATALYNRINLPQPAAADGGVRERVREFRVRAEMHGSGVVIPAEDIRAIESALSSHRQAGDGDGWEENFSYLLGRCKHTLRSREGGGDESLLQSAVLTFTRLEYLLDNRDQAPPPGPDLSKFRELAERWERQAQMHGVRTFTGNDHLIFANELRAALVEKGAGNGR